MARHVKNLIQFYYQAVFFGCQNNSDVALEGSLKAKNKLSQLQIVTMPMSGLRICITISITVSASSRLLCQAEILELILTFEYFKTGPTLVK